MASFNKVILIGNIVSELELKTTPSGINVCSFRIAVNRRFNRSGEPPVTDFLDVVAWRMQAEFVTKYFTKGKPILVCGSIQSRSWEDKEGKKRITIEIIADEVSFVERKGQSDAPSESSASPYSTNFESAASRFEEISSDDDLPF